MKNRPTHVDLDWINKHFAHPYYIEWRDDETNVVDDSAGCVVYTTPTTSRALENAVAFCRRHRLAIVRVEIPHRIEDEHGRIMPAPRELSQRR